MNENSALKYLAFITHGASKEDAKWARWLERKLENFRVPVDVVAKLREYESVSSDTPIPEKLYVMSRDSSKSSETKRNLGSIAESSHYLVVVCSPESAKSPTVDLDVSDFIYSGRTDYIVPFIIEGEPGAEENNCYPDSLPSEVLGVTLSAGTKEEALIRVLARLLDVKFSRLYQRHLREKRRFLRRVLIAAVFTMAVLSALAGVAVVNEREASARMREADKLARYMASELSDDRLPQETLEAIDEHTRKYTGAR